MNSGTSQGNYGIISEILADCFFDYDEFNRRMTKDKWRTVSLETCCRVVREVCKTNLKYHHSEMFAYKLGIAKSQLMYAMRLLENMGILRRCTQEGRARVIYKIDKKRSEVRETPHTQPKVYKVVHTFLKELKEAFDENWEKIKAMKPVYNNVFDRVNSLFDVAKDNGKTNYKRKFMNPETGAYTVKISKDGKKWWDFGAEEGGGIGRWVLKFIKQEKNTVSLGKEFDELENYRKLFGI